jgi:ubiquinone/menaquinone biosynthesis C-methylase UbiE
LRKGANPLQTPRAPEGFPDVDRTSDPDYWVDYLDRLTTQWRAARQRSFELLMVRTGAQILDVGSGSGEAVLELAERVGGTGRVVGIDRSERLIREAQRRAMDSPLPVEFRLGDAHRLEFADSTFHGCRADRVLMHLAEPQQALAEMARVTRAGGRVVVASADLETLIVDAPDRALTRRILNHFCDQQVNGWIGRQLPRLFHRAGLAEITVTPWTYTGTRFSLAAPDGGSFALRRAAALAQAAGVVTAAEATGWLSQLEEASRAGCFFHAMSLFIVSGRKP